MAAAIAQLRRTGGSYRDILEMLGKYLKHAYRYELITPAQAFDLAACEGNVEIMKQTFVAKLVSNKSNFDKYKMAVDRGDRVTESRKLMNEHKKRPMHCAIENGRMDAVKFMLDKGYNYWTVQRHARPHNQFALKESTIDRWWVNRRDYIEYALRAHQDEIAVYLLHVRDVEMDPEDTGLLGILGVAIQIKSDRVKDDILALLESSLPKMHPEDATYFWDDLRGVINIASQAGDASTVDRLNRLAEKMEVIIGPEHIEEDDE